MVEIDRNGLQILDREECMRLLRSARFGRVALSIDALPTVLPVNFEVIDDSVVFRTGVGAKLFAASVNAVVAFEVDEMDPVSHTGWSVVVTGIAREATDDALDQDALQRLPRWAPGPDGHVVSIPVSLITGRRLVHGAPQPEETR